MSTHGEHHHYLHQGCRCGPCKQANADYQRAARDRRAAILAADYYATDHGTLSTYDNWKCRCRPCKDANTARSVHRRSGHPQMAQKVGHP